MFKRLRKICLANKCNCKATHFGVGGRKSNGLCDCHYKDFMFLADELKQRLELIKKYSE